jgi:hypothetical protein
MPVTKDRRIRAKVSPVQLFFKMCSGGLAFLVFSPSVTILSAQAIEIKLVNGRDGSPLGGTCVNVWIGNERKSAMAIPTDKNGIARLRVTDKDEEMNIHSRWKDCGDFGVINPVVKYGNSLRINAGYVLCQPHIPDYSWLALRDFSMEKLIQEGIVTPNSCGKATASPKPGELVIFVRPLNWWEKLKR